MSKSRVQETLSSSCHQTLQTLHWPGKVWTLGENQPSSVYRRRPKLMDEALRNQTTFWRKFWLVVLRGHQAPVQGKWSSAPSMTADTFDGLRSRRINRAEMKMKNVKTVPTIPFTQSATKPDFASLWPPVFLHLIENIIWETHCWI